MSWIRSVLSSLFYTDDGIFNFKTLKKINTFDRPFYFDEITKEKKISTYDLTTLAKIRIEAQKIFNFDKKKYHIVIHPQSLVHAIVKFKNGTLKMLAHDTDMLIPIANSINNEFKYKKRNDSINMNKINNLKFIKPNLKQFPILKILKNLKNKNNILDIILIAANDELVDFYLKRKIKYTDINKYLKKILKMQLFRENIKKNKEL